MRDNCTMSQIGLTKVSFLIPVIGKAWPWIMGIRMCLAILQGLGGCLVRIYLAYWMKGFGLWLVPAALGIAMTLIVIPITILQCIWSDLATGRFPGVSTEDEPENDDPRGPAPASKAQEPPTYAWRALHDQLDQIDEPPVKRLACS